MNNNKEKGLRTYVLVCRLGISIEDIQLYLDNGYFLTSLEKTQAIFVKNPKWKK